MSQFTNWLIETHPEYVKRSRILEQVQGKIINLICPYSIFHLIRKLPKDGGNITWGDEFYISPTMVYEAYVIDKYYYPIRPEDFFLSPKERKRWKESSGQDDQDIDNVLQQARAYLDRGTVGAIQGWLPGWWKEGTDKENAIKTLMKWKGWEWKEVTFPPMMTTSVLNPISLNFGSIGNRNLLVIKKSKYDAERYDDMDKIPSGGTPAIDPDEQPKQTPPNPGGGTGGGTGGGRSLDQDDIELNKQLKITQDTYNKMLADAENKRKMDIDKKQKERADAATVAASKAPGAGGVPPGAGGAGGLVGEDDIFPKQPDKINPKLKGVEQYHLKNRPKVGDSMVKIANHFSAHGLEIYIKGSTLSIVEDSDDDNEPPKTIYTGFLDDMGNNAYTSIVKELWKATLQSNVRKILGKPLPDIARELGFKIVDPQMQNPNQLGTSSYGAAPIPKYNADDLNKGNQFWRFK